MPHPGSNVSFSMDLLVLFVLHSFCRAILGMDLPCASTFQSDDTKFGQEVVDFRNDLEQSSFNVYVDPGPGPFEQLR